METLPVIVPGALFSNENRYSYYKKKYHPQGSLFAQGLPRYQHPLEILFCAVNGYEPINGYISGIEDAGYRELYTKILEKVNELRVGLPSANNTNNTRQFYPICCFLISIKFKIMAKRLIIAFDVVDENDNSIIDWQCNTNEIDISDDVTPLEYSKRLWMGHVWRCTVRSGTS